MKLIKYFLIAVIAGLVLCQPALADNTTPYATWEAEDFTGGLCTEEKTNAGTGVTWQEFNCDGNIYETNSGLVNGSYAAVTARVLPSGCGTASLSFMAHGEERLATDISSATWTDYVSAPFKLTDTHEGSYPMSTTAINVQTAHTGTCELQIDKVKWYKLWEPYASSSVWNQTIAQKGGTVSSTAGTVAAFCGTTFFCTNNSNANSHLTVEPGDDASKPTFFAAVGDPTSPFWLRSDWNKGTTEIPDNDVIPRPTGFESANHIDGHLIVVSADKNTAWNFWRCREESSNVSDDGVGTFFPVTNSNWLCNNTDADSDTYYYEATNGAKWDTSSSGTGLQSCCGSDKATGRGSGTELVSSVIKADDVYYGFSHALGCDAGPSVDNNYLYPPAAKSDGSDNSTQLKYGQLWALDPNFDVSGYSEAEKEVLNNLKTYGCYIVDRGSTRWEINSDPSTGQSGSWSGITTSSFSGVLPTNMRLVTGLSQTEH